MKTFLKFLLGLALMVLVLAGCSNPAGPEIETPVIETPEDNAKLIKVEFKWSTNPDIGPAVGSLKKTSPRYLLGLRFDSEGNLVYDYPKGYDKDSYREFKKTVDFEKFYKDALEEVFGTRYCEEGEVIDLTQWTSEALSLTDTTAEKTTYSHLCFLTEDVERENINVEKFFDEIVVGNEDIVVYVYWNYFYIIN